MATCAGSTALKEIPFELIFNFTSFTNGDVSFKYLRFYLRFKHMPFPPQLIYYKAILKR